MLKSQESYFWEKV